MMFNLWPPRDPFSIDFLIKSMGMFLRFSNIVFNIYGNVLRASPLDLELARQAQEHDGDTEYRQREGRPEQDVGSEVTHDEQ